MILAPASTEPTEAPDAIPVSSVAAIAKIEDTIELILQEAGEAKAPPKVNKWHEKFAKSRVEKKK
jgi:sister chromatid cohesion protein DCC1